MKVIKYKMNVFEGALAWSHGIGYSIDEIFIPVLKLCFNVVDGELNVFERAESRSSQDSKEVNLPDSIGIRLSEILDQQKLAVQAKSEIIEDVQFWIKGNQ